MVIVGKKVICVFDNNFRRNLLCRYLQSVVVISRASDDCIQCVANCDFMVNMRTNNNYTKAVFG